jgi:nitrate reductase assembly molybdenum cofactor insertion protein NarJ
VNPYRYFSLIFSYPTEESLRQIGELPGNGWRSSEILSAVPLEKAQTEYTRLFISSYPALLCPPYESYYREGIVYGRSSVEVEELYEKHGLKYSYEGEPPDLLSAELDFLAITNDSTFLARMKEWVFAFTGRVKEYSKLYNVCADDLETFLKTAHSTADLKDAT